MWSRSILIAVLILAPSGRVLAQGVDDDRNESRSPILAGLASAIMPGTGQFMNGETWKGIGFLSAGVLAMTYVYAGYNGDYWQTSPRRGLLLVGVHLFAAIDAIKSAEKRNRGVGAHHGHLLETTRDDYVLGLDVAGDVDSMGLVVSVHY